MLKHLEPKTTKYLTNLLNLSIKTLIIPNVWKVGQIIPILKPGKPNDQGSSHRPISLLSPVAKLLEKLILPTMNEHLQPASHQHGFRKNHSTVTALQRIQHQREWTWTHRVKEPSWLHSTCQRRSTRSTLVFSWTTLKSRHYRATYNDGLPTTYGEDRPMLISEEQGQHTEKSSRESVPQGGVLSPLLFNLYLCNIPQPRAGIELISYTDDYTILTTGTNIPQLVQSLNAYLNTSNYHRVNQQLKEVNTPPRHHHQRCTGPHQQNPKILGVTFDPLPTFQPTHCECQEQAPIQKQCTENTRRQYMGKR